MINSLGQPQSVLLVGGSSDIGAAILRALPQERLQRVTLAGRASAKMDARRLELNNSRIPSVNTVEFDAAATASHAASVDSIFDQGDVDVAIVAFGVLGDQLEMEENPELAVQLAHVNYVGAMSMSLHLARRMKRQGHGIIVILSSVAGMRARRSNYIYGSSKAGLDTFAQGLADSLVGSGVSVVIVRPGFVRTSMTDGLVEAPFATDADAVGVIVSDAVRNRKAVAYAPKILLPVMQALRAMPRALFRRLT